jgi:hypothetical protein
MPEHSLAAYTLVIRKRRARGQDAEHLLGNFDDSGNSILPVLEKYLRELQWDDEKRNVSLRSADVQKPSAKEPDLITAVVRAGQYGVTSLLQNLDDPGDSYARTNRHVEHLDHFILVKAPPLRKVGTFIVHIPHGRGVKSVLAEALISRMGDEYPDLTVRIDSAVPAEVIRQTLESGRVTKGRFIRRRPAADEFDRMGEYLQDPTEGEVELVFKPIHRLGALLKAPFQKVIKGEAELKSLLSFKDQEFDDVKLEVDVAGRRRTISIRHQSIGRVTWDVSDALDYTDGKPSVESLKKQALDLVKDIEVVTGGQPQAVQS